MRVFTVSLILAFMTGVATAEKLPADAKPFSTGELKKIYSGNSMVWPHSRVYFAPNMTTKGLFGNPVTHAFSGTWSVSGNTVCMQNKSVDVKTRKGTGKTYKDCWKFYRSGKRILSLWTNNYDKQLTENDYWDGEMKYLKKGDPISKHYAQLTQ